MARTSTYLNFPGTTEAAFAFYREVFGTEYAQPIQRMGAAPAGGPPLSEAEQQLVLHVELPILGGHVLLGTDAVASMGHALTMGNNVHLNLEPDTRAEAERLFAALAEGGTVEMPLQEMFWGALWGSLTDRFGLKWMVNCAAPA
ncbi:MAG: VOC family protein [Candidatus Sericytochromatia bacterium]|nr:VOC family protein [Candidatus Sericytochromatia bacterium]